MSRCLPAVLVASATLCSASSVGAQVRVDLSTGPAPTTLPVEPGAIVIVIDNQLQRPDYAVRVVREAIPIATFSIDGLGSLTAWKAEKGFRVESEDPCSDLLAAMDALDAATAEGQVPTRAKAVRDALAPETCPKPDVVRKANEMLGKVTRRLGPIPISLGERLVVTIERAPVAEKTAPIWTLTLDAGPRGEWITTYGVAVVDDADQTYFSQATGTGKFRITPEREEDRLKLVPSVFYSWISAGQRQRSWVISPTAGIGLAAKVPAFFAGVSFTFNYNLSFVAGAAIWGQKRLLGRYMPNQEITENLSDEQLHQRDVHLGWMTALTFRFGSNPFDGTKSAGGPQPAPSKPAEPAGKTDATDKKDLQTDETPASPPTEAAVDPDIKLRFDAKGRLLDESKPALDELRQRAAGATDVFVLSHGWWNNAAVADCFYRRMIGGILQHRPEYLSADRFRPVFVSIYWPSAVFPMEKDDCESNSGREGRGESARPDEWTAERVRQWAAGAFPDAAAQPEFERERSRVAALLDKDRAGSLTNAEAEELAFILLAWKRVTDAGADRGEGPEDDVFRGSPAEIVQRWSARDTPRQELGLPTLNPSKWLNFGNAFTFWTMKDRAGVVGANGVYEVVRELQDARKAGVRVHLIGHSFGGKVVSASLTGHRARSGNVVDSLVILQGALSQFAFATDDQIRKLGVSTTRPGLYVEIAGSRLVKGPLVCTFSNSDVPLRLLYPAGVAIVNDVVERAAPRFGALGSRGIQGPPVTGMALATQALGAVATQAGLFSVDASGVILGHSDLAKPEVFRMIWDAVELASAIP